MREKLPKNYVCCEEFPKQPPILVGVLKAF